MTTTEAAVQASAPGIAERVRNATAMEHKDTESRSFITQLMSGELSLDHYVTYLAQYAYVYRALESRAAQPGDPDFVNDPALNRAASIESDLVALGAPDWESAHPALPATAAYVARLHQIGADDLPCYVAHHYTRYLGDMSGGQAISKLVARHYGATADQLAFYDFADVPSTVQYKRDYRDQLDALPFNEDQIDAMIAEAKSAFVYNGDIFNALGASA
ncbi:heme oxygenase (biliverdin-producing) [Demequina oxidasica]|uniref:biliverdin-producing heme oxygenase n=1 Tax=Demequina oxidasica TaxID=676199 RepID=UPI0007811678|nr:biliverdin-producing heme oxygenase [Demequina oxidasica]